MMTVAPGDSYLLTMWRLAGLLLIGLPLAGGIWKTVD